MKMKIGMFCKIYGNTAQNRVLEYILEHQHIDFSVCHMIKWIDVSKPKAYDIIDALLKRGIVAKSRVIGKTQMYKISKDSPLARIFLRNFDECLDIAVENAVSKRKYSGTGRSGAVHARNN